MARHSCCCSSSSSGQQKLTNSMKKCGSRQLEVVQYQRHCGLNYGQAQGEEASVKNRDNRNESVDSGNGVS